MTHAWTALRRPVTLAIAAALAATGLTLAPAAPAATAATDTCFGAEAMAYKASCTTDWTAALTPSPAKARADLPDFNADRCRTTRFSPTLKSCTFGDPKGKVKVALVGDSHAAHWFPAVKILANQNGWDLTIHLKQSCPWNVEAQTWTGTKLRESCATWNASVQQRLLRDKPTLILTSAIYGSAYGEGAAAKEAAVDGYARTWRALARAGSRVIPIIDNPVASTQALECLVKNEPAVRKCGTPRDVAFARPNMLGLAAARVKAVTPANLSRMFCTETRCPAAIGSVVVYRNENHLTKTFSRTLAPYLERRIPDRFLAAP
ncbi:SGNH hydrolase domain-containing protein [Demequina silvatica]|uniref:SGNH hydrolase domain-containing protein n=1 Tax=Demequina silvatica TaxID=1638988 RepID=UPI000785BC8D|nr:SGNH hydrolase domain-containing protein [Demequina silvatica]